MTVAEIEHREKCRAVILAHLTDLGYPNMNRTEIANEHKEMWRKLEESGLIIEGMSYNAYLEQMNFAFLEAEMKDFGI